ncbi:MAG TPA: prenyltransferase/squalene oxidase repeat-containing protein [Nitrososphaerales archaeon]|nr:prenyltransferase/squalene oxidase repeat-containing protein [Nitrososphaerales archaeon]
MPGPERVGETTGERGGAIDWLLEEDEPSVRYMTLTQLLGRAGKDPDVKATKKKVGFEGWAAGILAKQKPGGWWVHQENLYRPKYLSTNWMLLILSDLGLTKEDPRIRRAADLWRDRFSKADGGFGSDGASRSHLCIAGNTARALVKLGYAQDPKVKSAFEWLVKAQASNGGWSCFGSGGNLDSWEAMSAFAALPKRSWTKGIKGAVEKGAEFYLRKSMDQQGARYEPWYRFHYPVHYYYDLLVGLDFMTALGYGEDKRLAGAVKLLKEKMTPDGRWNLDAVHPDVEGGMSDWYAKHANQAPTPFALEKAARPSKMITFRAMLVLRRLGE